MVPRSILYCQKLIIYSLKKRTNPFNSQFPFHPSLCVVERQKIKQSEKMVWCVLLASNFIYIRIVSIKGFKLSK